MNKREKLVQQEFLNNEEAVIRKLKNQYSHALKEINSKSKALQDQINSLQGTLDVVTDEAAKAQLQSMIQSKVYQKQYQDALKKQIGSILDNMQVEEFKTVSEYLQQCYEDGFIGAMYDLQGQGIPLCFPMDQEAMVRAIQLDSKISEGLYTRLGEDVAVLKKKITAQISRGISTGMSFAQVAEQLKRISNIGFNNAVRIARTEGHRIQIQSAMDACYKAKDKGADVVKQWDSTLDKRTRPSHQRVDGEIRELDEPFSNGLMFPGDPSGGAGEVVNCRCALLQRARWALAEDELDTLKERAEFFGLDKTGNFDDYRKKYLKAANGVLDEKAYGKTVVYSDVSGNKHIAQIQYAPTEENLSEYRHKAIGIRTVPPQQQGKYGIGHVLPESYDWDFEKDVSTRFTTKETLGGSSTIWVEIDDDETLEDAIKKALNGKYSYEPSDTFIVGGDFVCWGDDPGEAVISDATVIGKIGIYDNADDVPKLSEVKIKKARKQKTTSDGSKSGKAKKQTAKKGNEDEIAKMTPDERRQAEQAYRDFLKEKYDSSNFGYILAACTPEEKKKLQRLMYG